MKRLQRIAWNGLVTVSAIVFVLTVAMWVRSAFRADIVNVGDIRLHRLISVHGGVAIESVGVTRRTGNWVTDMNLQRSALARYVESPIEYRHSQSASNRPLHEWTSSPNTDIRSLQRRAWVSLSSTRWPQRIAIAVNTTTTFDNVTGRATEEWFIGKAVWVPYWIPTLLSAILPGLWLYGWKYRLLAIHLKSPLCRKCGYDLRASPDRCPECGTVKAT